MEDDDLNKTISCISTTNPSVINQNIQNYADIFNPNILPLDGEMAQDRQTRQLFERDIMLKIETFFQQLSHLEEHLYANVYIMMEQQLCKMVSKDHQLFDSLVKFNIYQLCQFVNKMVGYFSSKDILEEKQRMLAFLLKDGFKQKQNYQLQNSNGSKELSIPESQRQLSSNILESEGEKTHSGYDDYDMNSSLNSIQQPISYITVIKLEKDSQVALFFNELPKLEIIQQRICHEFGLKGRPILKQRQRTSQLTDERLAVLFSDQHWPRQILLVHVGTQKLDKNIVKQTLPNYFCEHYKPIKRGEYQMIEQTYNQIKDLNRMFERSNVQYNPCELDRKKQITGVCNLSFKLYDNGQITQSQYFEMNFLLSKIWMKKYGVQCKICNNWIYTLKKSNSPLSNQKYRFIMNNTMAICRYCKDLGQRCAWCGEKLMKYAGRLLMCQSQPCMLRRNAIIFSRKDNRLNEFIKQEVPIVRGCPRCSQPIQNKTSNKHSTCNYCLTKFCHICLSSDRSDRRTLCHKNASCALQAIQQFT